MKMEDMKAEDFMMDDDDDDDDDMMSNSEHNLSFTTSPGGGGDLHLHQQHQTTAAAIAAHQMSISGLSYSNEDLCRTAPSTSPIVQNGEKSPTQSGLTSPGSSDHIRSSPNQINPVQIPRPPSSHQANSPTPSESNSLGALDLTPKSLSQQLQQHQQQQQQQQPPTTTATSSPGPSPGAPSLFSSFGLLPPGQGSSPLMSSALSSLTSSVLSSTAFSPLRLAVGPGAVRGNTTCNLCFKTFACNSALEIHYRSHTKERPFKCTVCDRGFSTKDCVCGQRRIQDEAEPVRVGKRKPPSSLRRNFPTKFPLPMSPGYATALHWSSLAGNMKQHMLTHKIRDMPQHMFDNKGDDGAPPPLQQPQLPLPLPPPQQQQQQQQQHQQQREREMLSQPSPQQQQQQQQQQECEPMPTQLPQSEPPHKEAKRAPPEAELPLPKRPPSLQANKHLCHVCNKNFSSSSALQIHMRTHTGDKPFRCTVCQKAFTTKGNLKVHMGTHMWSNGASRRGRRMSLDLPPIPMTPKDSEFLQRRPDLFYPYLPAPFLNGMQQKLNEISVVQNPQNGLGGAGKYSGLLGFGYPSGATSGGSVDALRSQSGTPDREQSSRPPSREPERLWDLHFERKGAGDATNREDLLPPGREGLAA